MVQRRGNIATQLRQRLVTDDAMNNVMDKTAGGPALRIGALAAEFGLNPKTIRFYEEIGLLPEPARSATGYRLYGAADRERLHFIIKAKRVGFTLEEIAGVFALQGHGKQPCGHVMELLDEKVRATDAQLHALLDYRERLLQVRTAATATAMAVRGHENACVCGIIEHQGEDDENDPGGVALPAHPLQSPLEKKAGANLPPAQLPAVSVITD